MENITDKVGKNWKAIVGFLVGVLVLFNSYVYVSSGEFVRVQSPLGSHTWYTTEGIKFKIPFLSRTNTYNQNLTIAVTNNEDVAEAASGVMQPQLVTFADTYNVTLESTFRFRLNPDPAQLESMHDAVKNSTNLIGNTLMPFARDLLTITASQFKAETFMQGGANEFKTRMLDQAINGIYVTKREKIKIATEAADPDRDREAGRTKIGEQYTYQVVIQTDSNGNPLRTPTAIQDYGVELVPSGIALTEVEPEPELRNFMMDKQKRVRARAQIIEEQENERQQAITVQLKGQRELVEVQNKLRKEKEAAVINGEKAVELAQLQAEKETVERQKIADLAIIDKKRELQIAKDNENIQKANAIAAKYEAQAIKEVGFAEAEVDKAKLAAKQTNEGIYLAELEKEVNIAKYKALQNFKVEMPQYVSMGSKEGVQGSLAEMSNMIVLDKLETRISKQP